MSFFNSDVPGGWATIPFEEAVETVSDMGLRVEQRDYLTAGLLPVIDQGSSFIGGYTDDVSKRYQGPLPVIAFGDHTRRVKYIDFEFAVGAQGIKLLRPRDCWIPKYLTLLLSVAPIPDRGYSRHFQFLRKLSLPLPPIVEQRRILSELERNLSLVDAGLEYLDKVSANLKRYRAAVLKAACEGWLVTTEAELALAAGREFEKASSWLMTLRERARQSHVELSGTAELRRLPDGWAWTNLDEVSWAASYGTSQKCDYKDVGPPVLRIPNIVRGQLDLADLKRATKPAELSTEEAICPGDFLIIRTNGSRDLIAKAALIRQPLPFDHFFASYLIRFRLIGPETLHRWIALYWETPASRARLEAAAATSAGQYNVNMRVLERMPIPLPPPAEIERILLEAESRLSIADSLAATLARSCIQATVLRNTILKKAFEGSLVPQDPNDEPASVLLEGIRQARTAEDETRPRRQSRRPAAAAVAPRRRRAAS